MKPRVVVATLLSVIVMWGCQRDDAPVPSIKEAPRLATQALGGGPIEAPPDAEDLNPDATILHVRLRAERTETGYAYNGQNPGPTLRAQVGDTLVVELENALDDPTTIHWHGVEVPFDMDGVTWMRDPVGPGETFEYRFQLTHAGTFWYHPHFNTKQQVDLGLYGVLIVEDAAAPVADREWVLVFDVENEDREGHHAFGHGSRSTNWLINGHPQGSLLTAQGGEVVRARLINASNVSPLVVRAPGLRLIAEDQGVLPALQTPEQLVLTPGDRAEVEWLIGDAGFTVETSPYSLNGGASWGEPLALFEVAVEQPDAAPVGLAWPFTGEPASGDDLTSPDILYSFSGSDRTGQWLINGETFPDITIETIPLGESAIIEVRNLSPTEHPFHLHGVSFEVLSVNGTPPPYKRIEDTINVAIRERVRLRVDADNPGDWMAHCHILPHADQGMMTVLRIE